MKIGLGTAQFGMDYGISNNRGKIPKKEVFEILDKAFSSGINLLDTAVEYGTSQELIGEFLKNNPKLKDIKIVTKDKCKNIKNIKKNFEISLSLLNINKLYGLLLHDFKQYEKNPNRWNELEKLKQENKVEKIGFSLYYPRELEKIINDKLTIDLIQIPYNIFDRRFEKFFPYLKKHKVEIHARSIFMQGLFFKDPEKVDGYFDKIKNKIKKIRKISQNNDISIAHLCIKFVDMNNNINKLIIGVDSLKNLKENLNYNKKNLTIDIINDLDSMRVNDENLLIPSNWPK